MGAAHTCRRTDRMAAAGGGAAVAGGWPAQQEGVGHRRAWSANAGGGCAPLQHWHSAPYGADDGCAHTAARPLLAGCQAVACWQPLVPLLGHPLPVLMMPAAGCGTVLL